MNNHPKKVLTDVKSFIVDRKRWYRGKGQDDSWLLNRNNKMCCLGFYAEACGVDHKSMRDIPSPEGVAHWKTKLVIKRYGRNNLTCNNMMSVNDDEDINDSERET